MKKILFAAQNLAVGGIQTSLINLLNICSDKYKEEYDITVFVFGRGKLCCQIPEDVKVIYGGFLLSLVSTSFGDVIKSKNIFKILVRVLLMIYVRMVGSDRMYRQLLKKYANFDKFDVGVSFFNDVPGTYFNRGTNLFVSDFLEADEKVTWVHNDPVGMNFEREYCLETYARFDRIVCVSKAVKDKFDEFLPEFFNKTEVRYNKFCESLIIRKAEEAKPFEKGRFDIVTVARIDNNQKRIDGIVRLCRRLKDDGVSDFIWRVVGDGPELKKNIKLANDIGVSDVLRFEGNQMNPYPYIKNSDLFALYSAYEGHPMVIGETIVLGTYIITTPYAAASEQVEEQNGIIAADDEDFYLKIKELILEERKDG